MFNSVISFQFVKSFRNPVIPLIYFTNNLLTFGNKCCVVSSFAKAQEKYSMHCIVYFRMCAGDETVVLFFVISLSNRSPSFILFEFGSVSPFDTCAVVL